MEPAHTANCDDLQALDAGGVVGCCPGALVLVLLVLLLLLLLLMPLLSLSCYYHYYYPLYLPIYPHSHRNPPADYTPLPPNKPSNLLPLDPR